MIFIILILEDEEDPDTYTACAQTLLLIATLIENRSAAESIWEFLKEKTSTRLLHLILQCLESDENGKY